MVKITSLLGAIAVAGIATAAPCHSNRHSYFEQANKCIPEIDVREYQSFYLKSFAFNAYLWTHPKAPLHLIMVGDEPHLNKYSLKMCVVSSEMACDPPFPTNCIYDSVDYVFRVEEPVKGYLKVNSKDKDLPITVTKDYHDATPLNFFKEKGWGLRIAHRQPDGDRLVFEAEEPMGLVAMNHPVKDRSKQWFTIQSPHDDGVFF
ncbi:hypothetical protein BGW42_006087 [Actinomortierella wolfii]|nr:hypothetical protein BGW42_006087 [Actinomortierella wolfii]